MPATNLLLVRRVKYLTVQSRSSSSISRIRQRAREDWKKFYVRADARIGCESDGVFSSFSDDEIHNIEISTSALCRLQRGRSWTNETTTRIVIIEEKGIIVRSLKRNVSHYVVWHVVWIWFYVSRQMKNLVNRSMKICSDENESYCTHALCHAESRGTAELAQLRVFSLCLYTQNTLRFRRFWRIFSLRFLRVFWLRVLQRDQHRGWCVVRIGQMPSYERFYSMTVSAEMTSCLATMKRSHS